MDSLEFLASSSFPQVPPAPKPQPIYVIHGDDLFLKRQVLSALRALVLGPDGDNFAVSTHPGDKATFAAVSNDLATLPFLSPCRLVIVENADPFITRERKKLEKYIAEPAATGVLVLDVKTWTSTTNLAKRLRDGVITCDTPALSKLPEWCRKWCPSQYGKKLGQQPARLLVDLVGADMGLLDQELCKLSLYVGEAAAIETADVDKLVNNSREEKIWPIFEMIFSGQTGSALTLLGKLFDQGEEALRILGAFGSNLRRLAQAAQLNSQGVALGSALERAGFRENWQREKARQQMGHLGRRRLDQLYDWLIQTDLGMKGSSQLPPRTLLERLVVQLARPNPKSR